MGQGIRHFSLIWRRNNCQQVLIGFFSASPTPNKMWIWDGDRASGIFLSFGEEITASEWWRRFIGSIGCRFKLIVSYRIWGFALNYRNILCFAKVSWNQLLLEHFNVSPKKTKVTISNSQHAGGWSTRHWDHETTDVTNSGKCARMTLSSLATKLVSKSKFLSSLEM